MRVNVVPAPTKEEKTSANKQADEERNKKILQGRMDICDAHLVKQMKANKTLMYGDLLQKATATITTFKP